LQGHSEGISFLDYSRDGRYVLTGGWDKQARVWDAATGQPITPFLNHPQQLERSNLQPASTFLLSGVQLALGNHAESERLAALGATMLGRKETVTRGYVDWYGEILWQLLADEIRRPASAK
jgi:hypothetical protein